MKHNPKKPTFKRVSAKDFAYLEIKQQVISGELRPDVNIVEESLSQLLDISRTPLREALQMLEFESLVVRQPNGRLKVSPVSVKEAEEIFNVRIKLEGMCVVQATDNATEEDIRNLSNIVHIKDSHREGSIEDILYYGSSFHTYIYELSRNETVCKILSQLNDHIYRYRCLVPIQNTDRIAKESEEHQEIIHYMSIKDNEGAEKAMTKHIKNSLHAAVEAIKPYLNDQ